MRCLFNEDYQGVDNWEELYITYIDLSGLGLDGQLGLYVAIHNLNVRLYRITGFLEFHSKVFELIGMPDLERMDLIKDYGYRLIWNPETPETFLQQLKLIEGKEKSNYTELKKLKETLNQMKKDEFSIMLNVLDKAGYRFDKTSTNMEELLLIIKKNSIVQMKNHLKAV